MILKEDGNVDIPALIEHLRDIENWGFIDRPFYLDDMGEKVNVNRIYSAVNIHEKSFKMMDYTGTMSDLSRPTGYIDEDDREAFYKSEKEYWDRMFYIEYGLRLASNRKLTMENSGKLFKGRNQLLPVDSDKKVFTYPDEYDYQTEEVGDMRALRDLMFDNATDWRWLTFEIDPGDLPPPPPEDNNPIEVLVGRLIKVNYGVVEKTINTVPFFFDVPKLETSERNYAKEIVKTPHWIGFIKNF